jgi:ferredoxin
MVNAALCQGCGTCIAACPAGAMAGTGFSDTQVMAQIEGLLASPGATPEPSGEPAAAREPDGDRVAVPA